MSAGGTRAREPEPEPAAEEEVDLTPLQREELHAQQERDGILTFPIYYNDGTADSLTKLVQLKAIFCQQLPKMPKEYISRLVLDRRHVSLVCVYSGEIVGGITYRPVKEQQLSEIVFCAVSADHQVQGYGTRIMNQIKEECKRTGIEGMLTYADNHAVGYFRKQGFKKNVIMKRERWQGYLKDYEGATLMECLVDPSIDYLSTRKVAEKQRIAVEKRIAELAGSSRDGSGKDGSGKDKEEANKEKLKTGWKPPKIEIKRIVGPLAGDEVPLQQYLTELVNGVAAHEDAWPFQMPVSITEAPDY